MNYHCTHRQVKQATGTIAGISDCDLLLQGCCQLGSELVHICLKPRSLAHQAVNEVLLVMGIRCNHACHIILALLKSQHHLYGSTHCSVIKEQVLADRNMGCAGMGEIRLIA